MIDALVQMLQRILSQTGIQVNVTIAPNLPALFGDQVQLQQVVLNLLVNAIDALRNPSASERRIHVNVRASGDGAILFAVEDSGPGVPPSMASAIFEPFHSTKSDGLGMGLAISKSIIEHHGGTMWLDSARAHGARFTFSVPLARP